MPMTVTQTEQEMQALKEKPSRSCKVISLTINLEKTVVMFQPAQGSLYIKKSC